MAEQTRLEATTNAFGANGCRRQARPNSSQSAISRRIFRTLVRRDHHSGGASNHRPTVARTRPGRGGAQHRAGSSHCHWHGGNRTLHQLTRPVARLATLSTYASLVARAADLRRDGRSFAEIADILNQEGWRPAKRRNTFNAPMVHHLLIKARVVAGPQIRRISRPSYVSPMNGRSASGRADRRSQPTLYTWVSKGRLRSRFVRPGRGRAKLVEADAATIAALKEIRATPPPWRRLPTTIPQPTTPTTKS